MNIEWYSLDGTRVAITLDLCRDRVADFQAKMDELAVLPDGMSTGKRAISIGKQRQALATQLAAWNARLYRYSGGSEGCRPGMRLEHV